MSERIAFQNSVGTNLVGVLHKPEKTTTSAVIISHGLAANKDRERLVKLADALEKDGVTAFRFDFGGSGDSEEREITVGAEVDDLRSAIRVIKDRGYEDIGLLGESLGGLVSLLSYEDNIQAIVLWAPVTVSKNKMAGLAGKKVKQLKEAGHLVLHKDGKDFKIPQKYFDERAEINRDELLSRVKIPVLIVHGDADNTVPITASKEAVKLLPKGSRVEIIVGGGHTMSENMNQVIPKTVAWFSERLL